MRKLKIDDRLKTTSISYSDIGQRREKNQDFVLASDRHSVYIIADGMGGLHEGKVASHIAARKMFHNIAKTSSLEDYYSHLLRATILTNQYVYNYGMKKYPGHKIGTTLTTLVFAFSNYFISHIGDSRCYLFRNDRLVQLTEDQTLKEHLQKISNEHSTPFLDAKKHILTQAIGISETCTPLLYQKNAAPGDNFLLCTDGFYNALSEGELARAFNDHQNDLVELSKRLTMLTRQNNSNDNISFILVKVMTRN